MDDPKQASECKIQAAQVRLRLRTCVRQIITNGYKFGILIWHDNYIEHSWEFNNTLYNLLEIHPSPSPITCTWTIKYVFANISIFSLLYILQESAGIDALSFSLIPVYYSKWMIWVYSQGIQTNQVYNTAFHSITFSRKQAIIYINNTKY